MDITFAGFCLKPREHVLIGPGGPVDLGARSFEILRYLIERPGELVAKSELFDAIWPGLTVEENNLQVQISTLRKLLANQWNVQEGPTSASPLCLRIRQ